MALPSWQERKGEDPTTSTTSPKMSFDMSRKFFAVDASASTMGKIMEAQEIFVRGFHGNSDDWVTKWDHNCQTPRRVDDAPDNYYFGCGGTSPDCILRLPAAVQSIKESDLCVLLTDGDIYDKRVTRLTGLAGETNIFQVPVILLVVGGRYNHPVHTNVSVGIPFFASAQEALLLSRHTVQACCTTASRAAM